MIKTFHSGHMRGDFDTMVNEYLKELEFKKIKYQLHFASSNSYRMVMVDYDA